MPFWGLRGDPPNREHGGRLAFQSTGEEAFPRCNIAPSILESGRISHRRLEGVIGGIELLGIDSVGGIRAPSDGRALSPIVSAGLFAATIRARGRFIRMAAHDLQGSDAYGR